MCAATRIRLWSIAATQMRIEILYIEQPATIYVWTATETPLKKVAVFLTCVAFSACCVSGYKIETATGRTSSESHPVRKSNAIAWSSL